MKARKNTSRPDPVSKPPAKDEKPSQQCNQVLKHCHTVKHTIYQIYVHLEVSEVALSKGASSEATEDPSDSTNHQLDHPNHDVGRAEIIEIILVIDMFVIVSGSL